MTTDFTPPPDWPRAAPNTDDDRIVTPIWFLDIDSTVRHGKDELGRYVNGPEDVIVFPEVPILLAAWRSLGNRIVGVSNQGGIGLGHVTHAQVSAAMDRTNELCGGAFDYIAWCPHDPAERCGCRKPQVGMFYIGIGALRAHYGDRETYPPHVATMIGDRLEDHDAAEAAGIGFLWSDEWRAQVPTHVALGGRR